MLSLSSKSDNNDRTGNGLIGYLLLSDWWLTSFTEEERSLIRQTYTPFGGCHLDDGEVRFSQLTPLSFLTGMSAWFAKDDVRFIAYRILDKAATYLPRARESLDVHFYYQACIEIYYRDRDTRIGLSRAIGACRDQIAYASIAAGIFKREYPMSVLPSHKGYTQLAIILEKQERYSEAIDVCAEAKKNGWAGDWDARIARCNNKRGRSAWSR